MTSDSASDAAALRNQMVDTILESRAALNRSLSGHVEAVMRKVPRHAFLPGLALKDAYAQDAPVMKRDDDGVVISSVTAPKIMAGMLHQLDIEPGHRVLEIGSGGYNAAMLRELVGPDGEVTTIDIDQDVINRARTCLATAGYADVRALCADGEVGAKEYAPFDRIIVTVDSWDIPPAWVEQLAEDGRLVVPFRVLGLTRSIAFERTRDRLVSGSYELCGFVPMQGAGARGLKVVRLQEKDVYLRVDRKHDFDAESLRAALKQPRVEAWSGVTARRGELMDEQDLWLATVEDEFCILKATQEAIAQGLVHPSWRVATPALVQGGSFAYRAFPRAVDEKQTTFEFGVYAHGPDAEEVANRFAEHLRVWDRDHRQGPGARFEVYPADTPDDHLTQGRVVNKRHTRVTISWP
ncbi:methyltransferase, FxLD system [Streptomyces sp. MP131-18]|uniref:methyltransferase, FxLD system n=1 Tax=Streptomyces sp. MP131-18 TaxID=1857892 RepID=UPI00097BFFAC|nr:methyltransferase, FxLD system [Streptomyces sp. MP131-18]ONK13302.1 Protein-L-isoaspartate O-methyltransferase [Streptomyces sp. MP131-18]